MMSCQEVKSCCLVLLFVLTQVIPQKLLYCKHASSWSNIREEFGLVLTLQRLKSVRALDKSLFSSGFSCEASGPTQSLGSWWPWKKELEDASGKTDSHSPWSCFSWGSHLGLCTAGPLLGLYPQPGGKTSRPVLKPASSLQTGQLTRAPAGPGYYQQLLCSWCSGREGGCPVPPRCRSVHPAPSHRGRCHYCCLTVFSNENTRWFKTHTVLHLRQYKPQAATRILNRVSLILKCIK